MLHPKKHERANRKNVRGHRPIDCDGHRQDEKQPIGRIKESTLHPAEIRRAAKDVRIPQREVSLGQLAEPEIAPRKILQEHVAALMSKNTSAGAKQQIGKHHKGQYEQQAK